MEEGDRVLVELSHRNPGPTRVAGVKGRALQFDGKDDFVECGEPQGMTALGAVTFDLWFQIGKDPNPTAMLIGKGEGLWIAFDHDTLVFHHVALKDGTGAATDSTRSGKDPP